ncbi:TRANSMEMBRANE PROTEIN [Salix viminalis]|uniref:TRANSMEMBRANE PROTEIN n=1 Tax=Salix viminalis TaxID=40686 RepID=A0A9Q0TC92_SALVM|nr:TRANSMEMBRANE PROTEIN [Salix viminalis]
MDRNGVSRLFLLFSVLIFSSGVSNASFLSNNRRLTALKDHGGNSSVKIQVSPSPSPDPAKTLNTTNTEDNSVSKVDNPTSLNNNNNNNRSNDERGVGGLNSTRGNEKESANEKRDDETKNVSEEKDHRKPDLESEVGGENCTTLGGRRCTDLKSLTACILGFDNGNQWWTVLIQNSGEHNLSVDVLAPNPVDFVLVEIEKQQTKMINLTVGQSTEVILNAKNGGCVLHLDPPESQANFFVNLPSFDKLITPINGAYFLIITVVVFGGTLACCMCWKGRLEAGIFYQELEMAMPESGVANDVETAGGWDNDWDDSWDEENAIKSPPARHSASVLANALTSRTPNKDGWENDWDR